MNLGATSMSARQRDAVVKFYRDLADGQVGMAYVGAMAISKRGRANAGSMIVSHSFTQDLLSEICAAVDGSDLTVIMQLMHSGRQASSSETKRPLLAASAIPCPYHGEMPMEASVEDLETVAQDFAACARFAQEAGCHMVEVQAANGYLLSNFISRTTNLRTDMYGGTIVNRFRLLSEVLKAVRAQTSVPIGVRVNCAESHVAGVSLHEIISGLQSLVVKPDFISLSAGMNVVSKTDELVVPARALGEGIWREHSRVIREALRLPTFLAGNISSLALAEELLDGSYADAILMGRALLSDPYLVLKEREGRMSEVNACTELYLCKYHSRGAAHVYCPNNPAMRLELRPVVDPLKARRKAGDHP